MRCSSFSSPSLPWFYAGLAHPINLQSRQPCTTQIFSVSLPSQPWSNQSLSHINRFILLSDSPTLSLSLSLSPSVPTSLSGFISADFQAQEWWTQQVIKHGRGHIKFIHYSKSPTVANAALKPSYLFEFVNVLV